MPSSPLLRILGRRGLRSLALTAFAAVALATVAAAQTLLPDALDGVRTKWEYSAGENQRDSLQPDLAALDLRDWMRTLEAVPVNVADLNLDPRAQLDKAVDAPADEFISYVAALRVPKPMRTAPEAEQVARWQKDIAAGRYTPRERDAVLLDFLSQLDLLKRSGQIKGNVQFILHQRQWLRPGGNARRVALRKERTEEFADDMADFINKARAAGLDQWITGVQLGENANPNMDELLPALLRMAQSINRQTDGWLRNRLFLSNGGGMGAQYVGLGAANFGGFLEGISQETGSFAFGYKWMVFEGQERHIRSVMGAADCGPRLCDQRSVADWTSFLGGTLGFDDLVKAISAWHDRYPAHANVVFVGDSSDALTLMVSPGRNGGLADAPQLAALRELWPRAPGWRGRVFMNGFVTSTTSPRLKDGASADVGMGLYFGDGDGGLTPLPGSLALFRSWPEVPPH